MIENLEVDWAEPEKFWDKSENERYQYFKNCCISYWLLLGDLERDKEWKGKAADAKVVFSNIMFFLCFLMTTADEQINNIGLKWIERFKKEIDDNSGVFMNPADIANA